MGYIKHHAIVVQGQDLEDVHKEVKNIVSNSFEDERASVLVSNIVPNLINFGSSFFIGPDGSEEHFHLSHKGDIAREKVVHYLRDEGVDFTEILFGGDDNLTEILN